MSKVEWFRRETWTNTDREDFNARLNRSRGAGNKAQYLRIQAHHLASVGRHHEALELLGRLLDEFPERIQLAQAHAQRAESLARLDRTDDAVGAYREALQAERRFPHVRTGAWLDFGWFVVGRNLEAHYDEVSNVLAEFGELDVQIFPVRLYRYAAIRAFLADARGEREAARRFARQAMEEASKTHSGLRYHASLGLVPDHDSLRQRLRLLAEN